MAMSDYLEAKLIAHVYGGTAYTQPSNIYVALFTSDPSDDASGTEVSGNGYQRQSMTAAFGNDGSCHNDGDITFPQATGDWGTITHIAVFDADTGGNMLDYGALTTAKDVNQDGVFKILSGDLIITYT